MRDYSLGQPVVRFEDARLLRGGGRFVDDLQLPGTVYGHVLRSPHAHARIVSIDTRKARAADGVLQVLTGADWQASGFGDLPVAGGRKKRDGSPMFRHPFPALNADEVRWVGDYVAFVIAETQAQAIDAAELIAVEYEPLPALVSTAEAVLPGAPVVWPQCPDNICFVHTEGDKAAADKAIASAHHVAKARFVINRVTAATMEPRGSVGVYDAASDRYTVYTTLQRAPSYRTQLAATLKVPESRLRVVAGDIGGSFGMKSGVYHEVALVLLGAKLTGRPVKWTSTRSEAFLADAQGRDNVTEAELALDRDGKFLGLRIKTIAAVGACTQPGSEGGPVSNLGTLAGVYTTPAIGVDVTAVYTHTNPMRPYRGNGRPEAAYVIERIIDIAADEMGIDPVELRRRNLIPPTAMPYKSALSFTFDCGEFEKNMDLALEMADYAGFEQRRAAAKSRGKLAGIGISNSIEKAAAAGFEGAEIRFERRVARAGARDHLQAARQRTARTRSGRHTLHDRRHRRHLLRRGDGRLAHRDDRRRGARSGDDEDHRQGDADRRPSPQSRRCRIFRRHVFEPKDQSQPDDSGCGARRCRSRAIAERDGTRPRRQRRLRSSHPELSQRLPHLRSRN
jgi:carbon-monoxide dehydrogenase large subunit